MTETGARRLVEINGFFKFYLRVCEVDGLKATSDLAFTVSV